MKIARTYRLDGDTIQSISDLQDHFKKRDNIRLSQSNIVQMAIRQLKISQINSDQNTIQK